YYWEEDLPILITTDAILQVWHLIYDHLLEDFEERILIPLFQSLFNGIITEALSSPMIHIIQNSTILYLMIAGNLINSTYEGNVEGELLNAEQKIMEAVYNELSIDAAKVSFNSNLTKRFIDDFTEYKPRGHYTNSIKLENYFRMYKWLSRVPFFFDNYSGIVDMDTQPEEMIQSAVEVTYLLKSVNISINNGMYAGLNIWSFLNSFLNTLVGQPNLINVLHLDYECKKLINNSWSLDDLNSSLISQIQTNILNNESIPAPLSPFIIDAIQPGYQDSPKTFGVLGERLTLDSHALNHVVWPFVQEINPYRTLPVSLDFPATCLNSSRAFELLSYQFEKYPSHRQAVINMQQEIANISGNQKETIHWKWIECLEEISKNQPIEHKSATIPKFMNSTHWLDEKLTTILGSWTQLRHDNILYTRRSTTSTICSTPFGYVEPYPVFYSAIANLSTSFKSALTKFEDLGFDISSEEFNELSSIDNFNNATVKLAEISNEELSGQPLSEESKEFIKNAYGEERCVSGGPFFEGWLPEILMVLDVDYTKPESFPNSRVSLVADIHTDTNYQEVFHTAVGLFEHIIAIVPDWNGGEMMVVGPVFSFYEFNLSDYHRLNDEEWRGIINLWLGELSCQNYNFNIFQRGFWAQNYMCSTEMTKSRIFYDLANFNPPSWF
ncbi:MAG: DUF3160 domain-containing protein, partial [Promethearchaeota archaeon]